jgi:hypothetical protein
MLTRIRIVVLLIGSLSFPTSLIAQKTDNLQKQNDDLARQELDNAIQDSQKLTPALANVLVRSKAASLLALRDPARADEMFLEVWNFALKQIESDNDREQALNTILKYLFPKNAKLAKRLADERFKEETAKQEKSGVNSKTISRLARLSSELIDAEPSMASTYLESALSKGVTPAGLGSLQRLRQKDPLLSDYVVTKTLDSVPAMRTLVSLGSLTLLTSYVFPESQSFALPAGYEGSLESLQFRYFATAYDALKQSLAESEAVLLKENVYSPAELKTRSAYQAQVALILAAIAPRYHPALGQELSGIGGKLLTQLPGNLANLAQFTASRLREQPGRDVNSEMSIPLAISSGNFQEASERIERLKSDDQRRMFSELLAKVQAKAALSKSDLNDALTFIRLIKDPDAKLILYMEAGKLAKKKDQNDVSRAIISEARILIPQSNRNGLHCRALLVFSSQLARLGATQEAFEFLDAAVVSLNTLETPSDDSQRSKTLVEGAWAELNDPQSMALAPEFETCFTLLGGVDSQLALAEAAKIKHKTAQLMARLAAIQEPLKRERTNDAVRRSPKSASATSLNP